MKKYLLLISCFVFTLSFATTKIISTSGTSFSPASTTILAGDTIVFNVGSGHTATEVLQATWNANGTTANGAFNFGSGSHQVIGLTSGTHYFVCQNHVGMGMKGTIVVETTLAVKNKNSDNDFFSIFPNPTKDFLQLKSDGIIFNKIIITSIDGKISKEVLLTNIADKISIADLPNASYILSAYTKENEVYERKFVKE